MAKRKGNKKKSKKTVLEEFYGQTRKPSEPAKRTVKVCDCTITGEHSGVAIGIKKRFNRFYSGERTDETGVRVDGKTVTLTAITPDYVDSLRSHYGRSMRNADRFNYRNLKIRT